MGMAELGLLQATSGVPVGFLSELTQALLGATKLHPAEIILSIKERKMQALLQT